jgi:hypothetical protein
MTIGQLAAIRARIAGRLEPHTDVTEIAMAVADLRSLLDEVDRLNEALDDALVQSHGAGVRADNAERREQARAKERDAALKQGAEAMRMAVLAEFERWFLAKESTVSFVRSLQVLRVDENKP